MMVVVMVVVVVTTTSTLHLLQHKLSVCVSFFSFSIEAKSTIIKTKRMNVHFRKLGVRTRIHNIPFAFTFSIDFNSMIIYTHTDILCVFIWTKTNTDKDFSFVILTGNNIKCDYVYWTGDWIDYIVAVVVTAATATATMHSLSLRLLVNCDLWPIFQML